MQRFDCSLYFWSDSALCILQGCRRSRNGQGKKFFKVRGESGDFILSHGKYY